jgi:hypothetical protein
MDIFEVLEERDTAQDAIADFDEVLLDDAKLNRSQAAQAAYMRVLFPNLSEACLRFLLPQPTIQGVCL